MTGKVQSQVTVSLGGQSCADAESGPKDDAELSRQPRIERRTSPQPKISNLAEFFGTILVSRAMNTSRYQEAAEATQIPERRYRAKRQRILVVEDDRLSLIVLRQLLTAQGYEILQSSEGWDGINRARNEQPDLIVMDIKLPDISGLDATLLLKKDDQTKDTTLISVTAFVTPEDKTNALKSGCDAHIAKPVNIGSLLRTVES